jgi:hypothetical protein
MNINTVQTKAISKYFILFITILLASACSESNSKDPQSITEQDNISENVIDASQIALVRGNAAYKAAGIVSQQSTVAETGVLNSSGDFTYPISATEFSGNISVSLNVSDDEGIKQVLLGFAGSELTLPICEEDCSNQFSAFVTAINPKLFGLSSGEQTLTLWVEDNDSNLSQVASLDLGWTELVVTGVIASINSDTEELTVSWDSLTDVLRYNVYLSNDIALTAQNYADLTGGEAKLALTTTSTVFTQKPIDESYYILVSAVDGSGESALSDTIILINGIQSTSLAAKNDNFTINEDDVLVGNLLTNDIGGIGSITVQTEPTAQPSNGTVIINDDGNFTYSPNANIHGTDQFSYSIVDDEGTTSTASADISIISVNDSPSITTTAPTSATEDILYTYTPTVVDEDDANNGTDLIWSLTNAPSGMEISTTGVITWTPIEGQLTSGTVSVTVTDGGEDNSLSYTETFTVNVTAVNDAPVFLDGNAITVYIDENSPNGTTVYTPTVSDSDINASHIFSSNDSTNAFTINSSTGVISILDSSLLNFEVQQSFNFNITVTDNDFLTDTLSVSLLLNNLNDSPSITTNAPTSATEDILYTYTPTVVDEDDANNGTDLIWSLTNVPSGMEISTTGVITWTPIEGQLTSGTVSVIVTDGGEDNSLSYTETFTVNVTAVNDAPVFLDGNAITVYVDENSPTDIEIYTLLADDPDIDAELTYDLPNGDGVFQLESKSGTLYVSNGAILDFESTASYQFNISVTDENLVSDTITVTVQVNDIIENTGYVLDTSFSDNGIADFNTYADIETPGYLVDAKLDGSNKRVILSLDNGNYTIAKVNQDGTFDLSFGHNGIKHLNYDFEDDDLDLFDDSNDITDLTFQKIKIDELNNKIYLLGYQSDNTSSINIPILIRLNSDGSIDNTFNTDGKYDVPADDLGDSTAVDAVIHSNGYIYLAASSMTSSALTKSFKLLKILNASNSIITGETYNITTSTGDDEYIIGLIENVDGNLVALGYTDDGGGVNIIASEIDVDTLLVLDDFETDLGEVDSINIINTYKVLDDNYVILGGAKTALSETESDSLIVKLNISTLELSDTFNGLNGYYTDDLIAYDSEETISIDINSDGDILYVIKTENEEIYINQVGADGTNTAFGNALKLKELTNSASDTQAVVLTEPTDTTNTINIFSSFEKENFDPTSTPSVYNTESEIYYQKIEFDVATLPSQLGLDSDRIDYDFQYTDSSGFLTSFLHSSGAIFTTTKHYDTTYSHLSQTTTSHNIDTGMPNQPFELDNTLSIIKSSASNLENFSTIVEINEADSNGSNYLISAEIIIDSGFSTLRLTKLDVDGNLVDSYLLDTQLSTAAYIKNTAFNADSNTMALFGESSSGPVIIRIQLDDYTPEKAVIDEFTIDNVDGLFYGDYDFTSGVVQNDNSIIALGTGIPSNTDTYMAFLIKLKADADSSEENPLDTTFDDYSADMANDSVLSIDIFPSSVYSGKLIQLSDLSLVLSLNGDLTSYDVESYLVKLTDSDISTPDIQEYTIDTSFSESGILSIDMSALSTYGTSPQTTITDFINTENDELILIGGAQFSYDTTTGFIAKFDSTTGLPDELLGQNSQPGYYIPNGDIECGYLQASGESTGTESDLCNITLYDKISIADDGSIIIHTIIESLSMPNTANSVILKFKEQQDDNATPYTIYSGSVD